MSPFEIWNIAKCTITFAIEDAELGVLKWRVNRMEDSWDIGYIPYDVRQYCLQDQRKGKSHDA